MTSVGVVRSWIDEEGWGVIDCTDTPGGCWTHFSALALPGYRAVSPGQDVELEWETAEQDGFAYRAVRAWPQGQEPFVVPPVDSGPSGAYRSELTITFPDGSTRTGTGSSDVTEGGEEGT